MITPPFQVTQDEEFIFIHMKVKYIKVWSTIIVYFLNMLFPN